jgi:hypothetical protein
MDSHCHVDVNSFLFQFLIFSRVFLVARYRARYLQTHIDPEPAENSRSGCERNSLIQQPTVMDTTRQQYDV